MYRLKLYKGVWHAGWSDGGTRRRSLGTRDKEVATRRFEDFKRAGRADDRHTVDSVMDAYLADKSDKPSHERMKWAWERLKTILGPYGPTK